MSCICSLRNPTTAQAAARVWRDGQKKRVYLYRMLAASCIEEKIFERQLSKEGLAGIATNDQVPRLYIFRFCSSYSHNYLFCCWAPPASTEHRRVALLKGWLAGIATIEQAPPAFSCF